MKILKIIGMLLLLVIVLVLIAGAFMKKDFHFERSTTINASKDKVWDNVVMFKNHEKWSQWKEMDPNMKTTITGTDGSVGAKMSWQSDNKNVGKGSQTITAITPGERVDTELDFDGRGKATAFMKVSGDSTSTKAVWGMDMHASYPMNAIMGMMMSEDQMNTMLDKGLAMLKTASEKE
jgi:uncharacterized protein YndB with AHSA1/START domain